MEKLIDDAIIEYITSEIIQVHLNYNVNKKTLDLQLELLNNSTYIFQNFTYALSWKPKHRLETEGIVNIPSQSSLMVELHYSAP